MSCSATTLNLRWPASLLDPSHCHGISPQAGELVPLTVTLHGSRVVQLAPAPAHHRDLPLALPAAVDPHCHLDKAFTWSAHPNPAGTVAGALAANRQEHRTRTAAQVAQRMETALELAWRQGYRALRSHVDMGWPALTDAWEAVISSVAAWSSRLSVQLVAMAPLEHWATAAGADLARRIGRLRGGLGGALDRQGVAGTNWRGGLSTLLALAEHHGCFVDLHLDETGDARSRCLQGLLDVVEQRSHTTPVTVSHGCSLSLQSPRQVQRTAARMAARGIPLVCLPTTNLWLQGRHGAGVTPRWRGLAPVHELQAAGVTVAVGGDNVADPWFPGGRFDPLELWRFAVPVTHLHPWDAAGVTPFTTAPARILGLAWDGVLRPGCPADLILLNATSWQQFLASPQQPRVMRDGVWIERKAS